MREGGCCFQSERHQEQRFGIQKQGILRRLKTYPKVCRWVLVSGTECHPMTASATLTNGSKEPSLLLHFSLQDRYYRYISQTRAGLSELFYYYLPEMVISQICTIKFLLHRITLIPRKSTIKECCCLPACLCLSLWQGSFCTGCPAGGYRSQVVPWVSSCRLPQPCSPEPGSSLLHHFFFFFLT